MFFPPAILRIYSLTNEFLFCFLFVNIKTPWSWLIKSYTTHQSGKKFDAEEKMFLDLTIHLGMLFADEWVGQQCECLQTNTAHSQSVLN